MEECSKFIESKREKRHFQTKQRQIGSSIGYYNENWIKTKVAAQNNMFIKRKTVRPLAQLNIITWTLIPTIPTMPTV